MNKHGMTKETVKQILAAAMSLAVLLTAIPILALNRSH